MKKNNLHIKNIMLSSVNGKIAFGSSESSVQRNKNGFVCSQDFERMRALVALCDVVFIGAKSIETEKGAFRVEDLRQNKIGEPEWIVFTQSGDISFQSDFWRQEGIPKSLFFISSFDKKDPPLFRTEKTQTPVGEIPCYVGNMQGLVQHLQTQNKLKAALLGGGKLNGPFWQHGWVDELYLTISPFVVGGEQNPSLITLQTKLIQKLKLTQCTQKDGFVYLDYLVNN